MDLYNFGKAENYIHAFLIGITTTGIKVEFLGFGSVKIVNKSLSC